MMTENTAKDRLNEVILDGACFLCWNEYKHKNKKFWYLHFREHKIKPKFIYDVIALKGFKDNGMDVERHLELFETKRDSVISSSSIFRSEKRSKYTKWKFKEKLVSHSRKRSR